MSFSFIFCCKKDDYYKKSDNIGEWFKTRREIPKVNYLFISRLSANVAFLES